MSLNWSDHKTTFKWSDYEIIYRLTRSCQELILEDINSEQAKYLDEIENNTNGDINPYSEKGYPRYNLDDSIEGKIFGYMMCINNSDGYSNKEITFFVRGENKEQNFIIARNIIGTMKLKLNLDPSVIVMKRNN